MTVFLHYLIWPSLCSHGDEGIVLLLEKLPCLRTHSDFVDGKKENLEAIIDLGSRNEMNGSEMTQDKFKGMLEYLGVRVGDLKEEGQISVVKGVI